MSQKVEKEEKHFKVVLMGLSSVGKTAIIRSLKENTFLESGINTIGIDFFEVLYSVDNAIIKLKIWDTAGQERFASVVAKYYKNADGILLVFDVTNKGTFDWVNDQYDEIKSLADPNTAILLIGNKIDKTERLVTEIEATEFAEQKKLAYIETSAKTQQNIHEAFILLCKDMIAKTNLSLNVDKGFQIIKRQETTTKEKNKKCC